MSEEKQPKYKIGDLVMIKSDGAVMTICSYSRHKHTIETDSSKFNGVYMCQWFAGKKLDSGVFPQESLVLVKDTGDSPAKK
ncbi:MAG: hypothetical protein [Bacteriophage sp.]|nr:MAG: hypothetical protein [Bacteriophage sp.]